MSDTEDIKRLIKDKRFVIGTDITMKRLKANRVQKIWLSSNAPAGVKEQIQRNAGAVEIVQLEIPNDELGVLCKKQFPVSICSVVKSD